MTPQRRAELDWIARFCRADAMPAASAMTARALTSEARVSAALDAAEKRVGSERAHDCLRRFTVGPFARPSDVFSADVDDCIEALGRLA